MPSVTTCQRVARHGYPPGDLLFALRAIHLVSRLRRRNRMCSSRVSDTAYRQGHGSTLCSPTEEKILCRSPFRSGRRSLVCVRLSNKGKVGVQRGRETAGVPSFLPPRRVPRRSRRPQTANPPAEVQRKTFRPLGANTLTQFEYPAQPVLKRSRPSGTNTLAPFVSPAQPVLKKGCRPLGAHTPAAVRVPPSGRCRKYIQKRAAAQCNSSFVC